MKKLTVNKQEELFAQDCKLINLRYEYSGFTGMEKWAIITELSEEALARLKEEYGEKAKGNVSYSKIKVDISAERSKEKNNNEGNTIDLQI